MASGPSNSKTTIMSTLLTIVEGLPLADGELEEIQQAIEVTMAEIAVTDAEPLGGQHAPAKPNKRAFCPHDANAASIRRHHSCNHLWTAGFCREKGITGRLINLAAGFVGTADIRRRYGVTGKYSHTWRFHFLGTSDVVSRF